MPLPEPLANYCSDKIDRRGGRDQGFGPWLVTQMSSILRYSEKNYINLSRE